MLMQLLASLLGLLGFIVTGAMQIVAQLFDLLLLGLADIAAACRHILTRLAAFLGQNRPPRR